MAQFPKVNPKIDGNTGSFFGKYPDYVELNFGTTNANILSAWNLGPNGAWPIIIQTIEQVATIEVLGAIQANCVLISQNGGNANVGVRFLATGVNAANAVALQSAIQALGTIATGNGSASAPYSNVNAAAITAAAVTIYGDVNGVSGGQNQGFPQGVTF